MNSQSSTMPVAHSDLADCPSPVQILPDTTGRTIRLRLEFAPLNFLKTLWAWALQVRVRQTKKRLRVCESVPLGEKRFIAVIQVDEKQFLVGGSSSSVSLLAELDKPKEFSAVLQSRMAEVAAHA
jgi:hypothetical protein